MIEHQILRLSAALEIGLQNSCQLLGRTLGKWVDFTVGEFTICQTQDLSACLRLLDDSTGLTVVQELRGGLSGRAALIFSRPAGINLVGLLGSLENFPDELDVELSGILTECGNIVLNGAIEVLAGICGQPLTSSLPSCSAHLPVAEACGLNGEQDETCLAVAELRFSLSQRALPGYLALAIDPPSFQRLLEALDSESLAHAGAS